MLEPHPKTTQNRSNSSHHKNQSQDKTQNPPIPKFRQLKRYNTLQNSSNKKISISEIYITEFHDNFSDILISSKSDFLSKIYNLAFQNLQVIFPKINLDLYKKDIIESEKLISIKYITHYNILYNQYQNYLKFPQNYQYLTHFRKHCINSEKYGYHNCENNANLIEIISNEDKNKISYVICTKCKKCYLNNCILLYCNYCRTEYYSCCLPLNSNLNLLPATWKKYHCININEVMKCNLCHKILYLNLITKKLVCLNKNCNFSDDPKNITWTCIFCKKEFKSEAKIYNPMEMKLIKKSIKNALLEKKLVYPKEMKCDCFKNKKINEMNFFHKEECKGLLYSGILNKKEIIVCSKCRELNFYDKFIWTCPICLKKFKIGKTKCNTNNNSNNKNENLEENKKNHNNNNIPNNNINNIKTIDNYDNETKKKMLLDEVRGKRKMVRLNTSSYNLKSMNAIKNQISNNLSQLRNRKIYDDSNINNNIHNNNNDNDHENNNNNNNLNKTSIGIQRSISGKLQYNIREKSTDNNINNNYRNYSKEKRRPSIRNDEDESINTYNKYYEKIYYENYDDDEFEKNFINNDDIENYKDEIPKDFFRNRAKSIQEKN